jgi:DNA-binding CsgD family transcriptional regulator
MYSKREQEQNQMSLEYARPRGIGWGGAATVIPVPSGDTLFISIEARLERDLIEAETLQRLDVLRPHIARAALLSARLAFERARAAAVALDLVGLPAGVLSHSHIIVAANSRLEELIPHVVLDRRQRVALVNPQADMLLAEALVRSARSSESTIGSVPIPATRQRPPYIVHVIPIRRTANDMFCDASALLVVTPVVPAEVPAADVLQGLFDLTPAEARVASGIAELQAVDTIAANLGVSRETIRTQLKSVLAKTGTSRQADLAALLAGTSIGQ